MFVCSFEFDRGKISESQSLLAILGVPHNKNPMYAHASTFYFATNFHFCLRLRKYAICVGHWWLQIIVILFLVWPAGKSPFLDLKYILILYLSAPFMVNQFFWQPSHTRNGIISPSLCQQSQIHSKSIDK